MKGRQNLRSWVCGTVAAVLLTVGFGVGETRADDLVTLSGATYHDVRPVRVEPDGVTWQYDEGMCKVDFADSPKSICVMYGYDAAKAAAYRNAQAEARRQAEQQSRQILEESTARRAIRMQAAAADQKTHATTDAGLIFRRAASPAASEATRALGQQMVAAAAKKEVEPTGTWGVIAHSRVGSILSAVGLVNFVPLDPVANKDNARVSSQSSLSSGHAAHDLSDSPDYSTRRYYDEVDRAAAFASGVPLRP